MSNLASKKYFIPGWALTASEYSDGEKLIIAAISTLSTQSESGRISTNMDSKQLAELTARHVNSVIRSISRLVSLGVLKRVKGGFLLIDQEAQGKTNAMEPTAQELAAPEAPAYADRKEDTLLNNYASCTTMRGIAKLLRDHGMSDREYFDLTVLLHGKLSEVDYQAFDALRVLLGSCAKANNDLSRSRRWTLDDINRAMELCPVERDVIAAFRAGIVANKNKEGLV